MSTPSENPRDTGEGSSSLRETLRRLGTPAPSTTVEVKHDAPQANQASGGLGESSSLASSLASADLLGKAPWKALSGDDDVERLAASLRWLQRQERATRFTRSGPLAPLSPFDAPAPDHAQSSDFRLPLSLEPQRLAPPPEANRVWPVPAAVAIACLLAAGVGYFVSVGTWLSPQLPPALRWQASAPEPIVPAAFPSRATEPVVTAALPSQAPDPVVTAALPSRSSEPVNPAAAPPRDGGAQPAKTGEEDRGAAAELPAGPQVHEPQQPAQPPQQVTTAAAPDPKAMANEPPTKQPARKLNPGEIELLVQRAQQFIATGDLVTARILFQRAAQAGDATAAVALGATYDPVVLAKLGVVGISPDIEKAKTWYRMAESLGSSEATRRLSLIANR